MTVNWTQGEYPVAPWDPVDLPPRRLTERCTTHPWHETSGDSACAYRDDDPTRCPVCHGRANCTCKPPWAPPHADHPREPSMALSGRVGHTPRRGRRVRIERDETRYPSKGSWAQYRGKIGTVIEINAREIGVAFGASGRTEAWFQPHEVTVLP